MADSPPVRRASDLKEQVEKVYNNSYHVCGARRIWPEPNRVRVVARSTLSASCVRSASTTLSPRSVDMSIDALLDREEADRDFMDLLIAYIPEAVAFIDTGSGAPSGTIVRAIAGMVPNGENFLADLEAEFAELERRA